jgi:hypothetical protein
VFNFPNSPGSGAQYTPIPGGPSWVWDSTVGAWKLVGGGLSTGVWIGDIPPVNPVVGQLWWQSSSGSSFIWFDDGSSKQWVQFNAGPAATSNMLWDKGGDNQLQFDWASSLLTLFVDGANQGIFFTSANSPASGAGYQKLLGGLILNWGVVNTNSNGDANVTFPMPFTTTNYTATAILNTGTSVPTTNFYGATICNIAAGGCSFQARSMANGGALSAAGTSQIRWMAFGI